MNIAFRTTMQRVIHDYQYVCVGMLLVVGRVLATCRYARRSWQSLGNHPEIHDGVLPLRRWIPIDFAANNKHKH